MQNSINKLDMKHVPNIFCNIYSSFFNAIGYICLLFSFCVPWFKIENFSSENDVVVHYFDLLIQNEVNYSNVLFCYLLLGLISGFMSKFLCVFLERKRIIIFSMILLILEIFLFLPIVHYMNVYSRYLMILGHGFEYQIVEGYTISLLGNFILMINSIVKIGLLTYKYVIRRRNYSVIKKPEFKEKLLNFLTVERVSVYPEVFNSCMKSANSQQDNRNYYNSNHLMFLELSHKEPS